MRGFFRLVVYLVAWCGQIADVIDSRVHVFVFPIPLAARDLDAHVGTLDIFHAQNGLGRGEGHANQNEERDDGPHDFELGVVAELRRLVPDRFSMLVQRIEHHAEHDDENDQANQQDQVVEIVDFRGYWSRGGLEIELVVCICRIGE